MCSQEDWGQMSAQSEEVSITEEDLELIKERETNIRQLEVGSSPLMAEMQHVKPSEMAAVKHTEPGCV